MKKYKILKEIIVLEKYEHLQNVIVLKSGDIIRNYTCDNYTQNVDIYYGGATRKNFLRSPIFLHKTLLDDESMFERICECETCNKVFQSKKLETCSVCGDFICRECSQKRSIIIFSVSIYVCHKCGLNKNKITK